MIDVIGGGRAAVGGGGRVVVAVVVVVACVGAAVVVDVVPVVVGCVDGVGVLGPLSRRKLLVDGVFVGPVVVQVQLSWVDDAFLVLRAVPR